MIFELTGFQRDLLFVVSALEEPSGQEIRAELERTQDRNVQPGQLYRNLDQLVDRSLIRKRDTAGRANHYTITEKGETVVSDLHDWRQRHLGSD